MKLLGQLLLLAFALYCAVSSTVFRWRNPKANDMAVLREVVHVLRFEKLDRYQ